MNVKEKKSKRMVLIFLTILLGCGAFVYGWLFADLPSPGEINGRLLPPTIRITDRQGRPLYDMIDNESGRNTVLALHEIPLALQQATIVTEDKSFYENPGIDVAGILRALWINVQGGEVLAGGSTITQQVTRNLLLDADERTQVTLRRKLRESWLAWRISQELGKEDILALYLNEMYYGGMAYGVEAAAQTYFGKTAVNLTLAESALIAGLPQAPSLYNPLVNPEAAKTRQKVVLDLMLKDGVITPEQHELAAREPLFYAATPYPVAAPHFVMMVQVEVDRLFPEVQRYESGGLTVRTTLDLDWQEHAESIVREQIQRLNHPLEGGPGHNAGNAALVAIDPQSGQVMALVGNPDYFDTEMNGAVNMALMPRQPGSALKPIIYAAAMAPERERPFTPATVLFDVRTVFMTHENEPYVPVNYSRNEHGPVLVRQALGSSLNIPAVLALDAVGVEKAMGLAEDMGINTLGEPDEYDLSFALGGGPVRLFDLTTAYAAFANGGSRIEPTLILDVTDAAGKVVYRQETADPVRVLDERVAWLVNNMLSDNDARVLSFGKNSILKLDRTAAVKTGTTNDFHDNWTVGYTTDLVVGVWVGNANNQPMRGVTGVSGAGPIWHYFMRTVLAGAAERPFTQPPGMVQVEVCTLSGLLPTEECPYRKWEWFVEGTQPTEFDPFYRRVAVEGGELQVVLDLPPVLHPWAREEGLVLLDDLLLAGEVGRETAVSPLRMVSPDANMTYRLSPSLPEAAQQLHFEVVSSANLHDITIWMDDEPLATLPVPPYEVWWQLTPGTHTVWAEGVDNGGAHVASEPLTFEVVDGGDLSSD